MTAATPFNSRNQGIDNIKAVLIFLVVFGHLIEIYVGDDHVMRSIWIFIYSFHMPMFALISGMFSKASWDDKRATQVISNVLVPLIAFEIIYETTEFLLKGNTSVYANLIAPYWMLWYLLSLLCWRLLLPLFARLQFGVALALGLSLIGSYSDHAGYFFSISRTLVFFPYFLLGWKLGQNSLSSRTNQRLILSVAVVLAAIVAAFMLRSDFDYRWFYGSYSLRRLEMANLTGSMYQLLQYAVSGAIGLAVLYLLTQRDLKLAAIGKRSLYVLVWHGMALIILQETGILRAIFRHETTVALVIAVLASAVITWLCSHEKTERYTERFILSPLRWLLVAQLTPQTGAAPADIGAEDGKKIIQ